MIKCIFGRKTKTEEKGTEESGTNEQRINYRGMEK
jgi:hypothetical protein